MVKGPEAPVYVNGHNGPTLQIQFIARKSAGDYFRGCPRSVADLGLEYADKGLSSEEKDAGSVG
jgi:hypothetical protein